MAYFSKFPILHYDINKDNNRKLAVDILKRISLRENVKNELSYSQKYTIQDGETPEMVAYKFYGNVGFHWIILLLNEITNPYTHWPISEYSLDVKMSKTYPHKAFYIIDDDLQFEKDMEIWVYNRNNITKREIRGLVKEWNPTTRKLVLYNTSGTFLVDDILIGVKSDGTSVNGTIGRIVDIHKMGLHHFEDNSGNILNPLATPPGPDTYQKTIGEADDEDEDGDIKFSDTILYSYVTKNDADVTEYKTVTFEEYERKLNDSKRNIKILRKEMIEIIVNDLGEVFK